MVLTEGLLDRASARARNTITQTEDIVCKHFDNDVVFGTAEQGTSIICGRRWDLQQWRTTESTTDNKIYEDMAGGHWDDTTCHVMVEQY